MLPDTLFGWLLIVNALLAARFLWTATNVVGEEVIAKRLEHEASLLWARIEAARLKHKGIHLDDLEHGFTIEDDHEPATTAP